jgi:CO/xanthine dehydrogenase Mo-binding subunit
MSVADPRLEVTAPSESGGQRRVEGNLKVNGDMPYAADIRIAGTLHVAVQRSPYPHARIVSVDKLLPALGRPTTLCTRATMGLPVTLA